MLPSGPKHEWLELVKHWQQAPDTPVWFLAESGRNDLALVDPASRRLVRSYTWPFRRKFLMSRVPKTGLDWYAMQPPGWIAGEGWSLSPEAAGVAWHDRQTPGDRSVVAFVRRRDEGTVLMVGGWNLSGSTGPTAKFELSIDQQPIDSWVVEPGPGSFLKTWELPAGILTGPGTYVPLRIRAIPTQGNEQALNVVIDQFDLQSQESVVYGFDSGWFQQEYDGAAPRPWRWTGPAATLRVHSAGRDLVLRVAGELPLKYLGRPPQITVSAGAEPLARVVSPEAVLGFEVRVPAGALHGSGGFLRIETDRTFVPDEVIGNGDRRKLGLRVYELELRGVSDSS
jgi:hypothetical protein